MKETLEQVGFTQYEADIYLCLLQNGPLTAYEVAGKTGHYRQVCYDALNRMLEKGHVTKINEGRTSKYSAATPETILEDLKATAEDFTKQLPTMLALQHTGTDPVHVEVFKGKHILRRSFKDVVKTLKEHSGDNCCTAVDETHYSFADERAMTQYKQQMLANGLHERVIIKENNPKVFPQEMTTYRSIPEKYFNPFPVQIYGDTVQILLGGHPSHMILIRNQTTANSFKKMFELMWSVAKPV